MVNPDVTHAELMGVFHGPDFATGGLIVDSAEAVSQAYETGRGSFRVRGRFFAAESKDEADREAGIERLGGGQYQLVVSEVPYGVPKGRLIEQIAQLIADRKLPILEDVRDESDEQIRIVFVPKSRNVDPELLKESLYKLTDLETRFGLNLNVLDASRTPMVMGLRELLTNWIAHQIDILQRRSRHRLQKIADRLELVEGYIIAFLNLDRVIEIIRTEDEPKPVMMAEFGLTDRQAEAILNMRLRAPAPARGDGAAAGARRPAQGAGRARSSARQPGAPAHAAQARSRRAAQGLRRGHRARPPPHDDRRGRADGRVLDGRDDREGAGHGDPLAARLDPRGAGHLPLEQDWKFKEGDGPAFALHAQTTDKLLLAADDGRFFTIGADKLPGARGFGEPIRNTLDIDAAAQIMALVVHKPGTQLLLASRTGHGFAAVTDELLAETRKGRQVVNLKDGRKLAVVRAIAARARPRRGGRREPQAGGVQPRGAAGDGARAGGDAAALPRRRAGRRDHVQARRGAVVGDGRRERPHADREGHPDVEGRSRRRRGLPPTGVPAGQQVLEILPVVGREDLARQLLRQNFQDAFARPGSPRRAHWSSDRAEDSRHFGPGRHSAGDDLAALERELRGCPSRAAGRGRRRRAAGGRSASSRPRR